MKQLNLGGATLALNSVSITTSNTNPHSSSIGGGDMISGSAFAAVDDSPAGVHQQDEHGAGSRHAGVDGDEPSSPELLDPVQAHPRPPRGHAGRRCPAGETRQTGLQRPHRYRPAKH